MSTVTLQSVIARAMAKGIPSPLLQPSGFGEMLALSLADDVMQDILSEKFNFKWNSNTGTPFYTNSLQQDYPMPGSFDIGWLETADRVTINSTTIPPYTKPMTVRRQLPRTSRSYRPVDEICWMYNQNMQFGVWPGPGVAFASAATGANGAGAAIYTDLTTNGTISGPRNGVNRNFSLSHTPTAGGNLYYNGALQIFAVNYSVPTGTANLQLFFAPIASDTLIYTYPAAITGSAVVNPITNFVDANGNILVLTTVGTTGTTQPAPPADSADGTTVADGTCVWTVASPIGQGYRLHPLPSANGQIYLITPVYQAIAIPFTKLKQTLAPIPDDQAKTFRRGYEIACKGASASAQNRKEALEEHPLWIAEMMALAAEGDREMDAYGLVPVVSPVESLWSGLRDPTDPGQPF